MKLLVFGSTGQVATELAKYSDVTSLSRADADLNDPEACVAMVGASDADAIINAAAYTAVDRAEEDRETAFSVNGLAPAAIAHAAADRGLPFVHISTDYVFDGSGTSPWHPEDNTAPLGVYGASKLAGEEGVRAANGPHAILRTSWVFSAHGSNFVKTMLRLAETRDKLSIVTDQIGGPTSARAIADAAHRIAKALLRDPDLSGTYHFSGTPDVSWADFAAEIFAISGKTVEIEPIPTSAYPTPAARPANSRLDCQSILAAFGIERPNWREDLAQVIKTLQTT